MDKKTLIIGLGTGRCGSMSLSKLLNLQKESKITHELEQLSRLPWEFDRARFYQYVNFLLARDESFVGDISFYLLPYVDEIRNLFPEVKFIILQRNKKETIDSYLKKTNGRNHWMHHNGGTWSIDLVWDSCYPKFAVDTKEQALSMYYDSYYNSCRKIESCFWIKTEDLNNEQRCLEMLEFCGFEEPIWEKSHKNKGK